MCNAKGHRPNCTCGWGGEGHLGRSLGNSFFYSNEDLLQSKVNTFNRKLLYSYTIPNASCPVCGKSVFFYRSPYDGKVFFDSLGIPWPKHPCTDKSLNKIKTSNEKLYDLSYEYNFNNDFFINGPWKPFEVISIKNKEDYFEISGRILKENKLNPSNVFKHLKLKIIDSIDGNDLHEDYLYYIMPSDNNKELYYLSFFILKEEDSEIKPCLYKCERIHVPKGYHKPQDPFNGDYIY